MQDRKGKDSFEIGNMNPTCPYPGSSPKIKKITLEPGEKIVGIKYRENPERKYIQIDTEFTFIIAKALDL